MHGFLALLWAGLTITAMEACRRIGRTHGRACALTALICGPGAIPLLRESRPGPQQTFALTATVALAGLSVWLWLSACLLIPCGFHVLDNDWGHPNSDLVAIVRAWTNPLLPCLWMGLNLALPRWVYRRVEKLPTDPTQNATRLAPFLALTIFVFTLLLWALINGAPLFYGRLPV